MRAHDSCGCWCAGLSHRRCIAAAGLAVAVLLGVTLPARSQEAGGKKVALLIGVNKYDKRGFRDLEYAERDVQELKPLLEQAGYSVDLLTGSGEGAKRATLKNIRAAVEALLKDRNKHDLVLIALAGHGLQLEVAGPDGKLQSESFFCPCDAVREEPATMLPMGKLFEDINRRGGGHNLVLVDACREDPTRGRGMDGSKVQALPEGVAVLFGCRAGQKTFESKRAGGGHGVFFHFVLEGLRGKAKNAREEVTWARLVEYVTERVGEDVRQLLEDDSLLQTPNLIANLPGISPVLVSRSLGPPRLVAPFDAKTARERQQAWAKQLGQASPIVENSLGMKLALVPPGEFLMGGHETPEQLVARFREDAQIVADGGDDPKDLVKHERPQHKVRITRPFFMGTCEVTLDQFLEFYHDLKYKSEKYTTDAQKDGKGGTGWTGSEFKQQSDFVAWNWGFSGQTGKHPVVNVSWNDAVAFCEWLSKKEGKKYLLPTEAEWEYACRAGTTGRYYFGEDPLELPAWENVADLAAKAQFPGENIVFLKARDGYAFTAPVGQIRANPLGLHDMLGNVAEWCLDGPREYDEALQEDPRGPRSREERVIRGGHWSESAAAGRCAWRDSGERSDRGCNTGFRLVREP
jgi:sulfatase modifying factor 1